MTPAAEFDYAIDVEKLNKHFDGKHVVKDVSLRVRRGEIFGFLGPNGSGKTTTIRMMCGLLKPDSGSGTCLGHDIRRESTEIKRNVGYMTQRFSFWEDLTIAENLDFVARMYQIRDRRRAIQDSLAALGLSARAKQLAGELSGGWKQRLALAACMLHGPQLLLLDEPTAGVDPRARRDFWDEIQSLAASGISVLVSTHYMDEAVRCHKLAYISAGTLLAQGTAEEIIQNQRLSTWAIHGDHLAELQAELRKKDAVKQTVTFGDVLHVSGTDDALLSDKFELRLGVSGRRVEQIETDLEDVFIYLMTQTAHRRRQRVNGSQRFSAVRWWSIVLKEFTQLKRDRLTFAMIVGIPILQMALFGYAINTNPKHLDTGIISADDSNVTRSFIEAMQNSSYFRIVGRLPNEEAGREALARGQLLFVVNIPAGFTRQLLRREHPSILIEADATDPTATESALAAVNGITQSVIQRELTGPLASLQGGSAPFDVSMHQLYNPDEITQYNVVPGLMGVILTLTMVMMTGLAITRERERGTMENLLAMPSTPLEVMSGKLIPYIGIGLIQASIILLAARYVFQVPFFGNICAVYLSALLFIAANLTVGITLSSLARNQLQAVQLAVFYFLPNILLSGFMFPFKGMPAWAQAVGNVLPLTYFNRLIRGILLKGNGWADSWPSVWPMAVFTAVLMGVAVATYRRTLD